MQLTKERHLLSPFLPSLFTSILVPEAGVVGRGEDFAARSRGSSSFEKKKGNGSGSRGITLQSVSKAKGVASTDA